MKEDSTVMSYELSQLEKNKVRLTIAVSPEDFQKGLDKAYHQMVGKITIPGFRKGKAPRRVIENFYGGPSIFFEDALRAVYPDAYAKAVEESGINPVDAPEIDVEKISVEEGVTFHADVWVYPEVELGQYKNLPVEKPQAVVTDDDVNAEIDRARDSRSRWVTAERAIENGDTVTFDFEGFIDDKPFEGGSAKDFTLEIGSGRFIPGFEEQMVGLSAGEEKDLSVTFPEDYHAEELKGKPAIFKVTIKEVKTKQLPELDDAFAQDAAGFDTMDEYIADVRKHLEEAAVRRADAKFENDLVDACVADSKMEVPQPMVERMIDSMVQDMQYRLMNSGIGMEDYLKYTGMSMEDLRGQYAETALQRVKGQLVLQAIQKAENLTVDENDIEKEMLEIAERIGQPVEEYKKRISEREKTYLADDALLKKTLQLMKDNAAPAPVAAPKPARKRKAPAKAKAAEEQAAGEETADKPEQAEGDKE
nr:trigger factor [bacterium]